MAPPLPGTTGVTLVLRTSRLLLGWARDRACAANAGFPVLSVLRGSYLLDAVIELVESELPCCLWQQSVPVPQPEGILPVPFPIPFAFQEWSNTSNTLHLLMLSHGLSSLS